VSDLDVQISEWRVSLEQRLGPKSAAELEDHLRATIDSLAATGLSEPERFSLASHRIGHAEMLSREYAKNDPFGIWRERTAWMLVGMVPLHMLWNAIKIVGNHVGPTSLNWGWSPWAAASIYLALQAMFIIGPVVAFCLWVGKTTRSVQWTPARWIPTSFSKVACLLAVIVVALYMQPVIAMQFGGGADAAHRKEFNELLIACSIGESYLEFGFYIVAAVLIAWLTCVRRVEPEATTT
jgi:hypothetical protein